MEELFIQPVRESSNETFYSEMITALLKDPLTKKKADAKKKELCLKYRLDVIPSDIQLLLHAKQEDIPKLNIITKPVRTQSGVSPIAVMTAPARCPHGKCTFCPGGIGSYFGDVPQSYTGHEPATLRGMRNDYDAYLQVSNRLEQYTVLGQCPQKAEIIIMGGTFPSTTKEYQDAFVASIFKAMNDFEQFYANNSVDFLKFKNFFELPGVLGSKSRVAIVKQKLTELKGTPDLNIEQQRNQNALIRCIGLTIETKPDWGMLSHANQMLKLGCTRVELGVESVYDDALSATHRGHTTNDTKKSIQILKDVGFKINAHYMPGLPSTTKQMDILGMQELFTNQEYCPDMLKIYPTMVSPGTSLWHEWKAGKFTPLTTKEAAEIITEFKKSVPRYCRIMRVQRDVPTKWWAAGVGITNLRQHIHEKYNHTCQCIRCREPKGNKINHSAVKITTQTYPASGGMEHFISADDTDNDFIIGFCRLRFPSAYLREEITSKTALIRELHVYGTATPLGTKGTVQHKGYGKQLLQQAEEIARQAGKKKMLVLAGIGVREYYAKQGYMLEGPYMSKELEN